MFLAGKIHENAVKKGFWDKPRNNAEEIALIHSELSEGLEALRGNLQSDHIPAFLGIEEEMADAIIRILDLCYGNGWHVAEAIFAKMKYNAGREYLHGKNF